MERDVQEGEWGGCEESNGVVADHMQGKAMCILESTILVFHESILLKWPLCINSYLIYVYNDSGLGLIASFSFMHKFKFEVLI